MKWVKKEASPGLVKELAARFGLDLLTASIFVRRGISSPEELLYYLEDDPRYLHNPFLFKDMEDAVDRILMAKDEGEKLLVFGDRDADGVTSTVLLVEALRGLGLEVSWKVPAGDEAYGLSIAAVDEFAAAGGSLILTVDCGISNHAEALHAAELGVDLIILDHHLLKAEEPPAALALIDPKVPGSGYPFRDLAGCGVAYKLVSALKLAMTGIYKQQVALLNVRPVTDAYLVEAVLLSNLVETGRIRETIVPGMVDLSRTRLVPFLQDRQIFVWDGELQRRLLEKALGRGAEVQFYDVRNDVAALIPQAAGQSLLRLKELSKIGRYREKGLEEIDLFENLFVSFALKQSDWFGEDDLARLQLVALGTVADLMPLRGENRILVRRGIEALNKKPRPGILELLQRQNLLGKKLGANEAAWQITPILNAAGRMGSAPTAVRLLLGEEGEDREALADEVIGMNQERRRLGAEVWEKIYPLARESFAAHGEKLILIGSADLHRGITGVIASRLASTFEVPSVAASFQAEGRIVGSVRSARGFPLSAFLEASAELFIDYGGHDAAAGFSLSAEHWPEFERRALAYVEAVELAEIEETIFVDAELPHEYLKPELAALTERFEPYGEENPPLVFLARKVPIAQVDIVGRTEKSHLKLTLDFGAHKWPALFWSASERYRRDFDERDLIDLVFKVTVNRWNGMETPQLEILDLRRSVEAEPPKSRAAEAGATGSAEDQASAAPAAGGLGWAADAPPR